MKLLALLFLVGCSTTPMTEREKEMREWKRGIDRENWINCQKVVSRTWHINHSHNRPHTSMMEAFNIRSDLVTNGCQMHLGEHWIEY